MSDILTIYFLSFQMVFFLDVCMNTTITIDTASNLIAKGKRYDCFREYQCFINKGTIFIDVK